MPDLPAAISALDRSEVLEAAQLLADDLGVEGGAALPPLDSPILDRPLGHQDDIEDLARVLLLTAAESDPVAVRRAIDGAGRRQLILGGAEIVALAVVALGAIQLLTARGRTAEEQVTVIERASDGTETVKVSKRVEFGVSASLGALLRSVLGGSGA